MRRLMARTLAASHGALALAACDGAAGHEAPRRATGPAAPLGDGTAAAYATFDATGAPTALGVRLTARALATLPSTPSDGHHCVDRSGDGATEPGAECAPAHEWVLPLPDAAAARADLPFKWVRLVWRPAGHSPPGIYDLPHLEVEFHLRRIEEVLAIAAGPCGPERVRCDQYARGRRPVPPNYVPSDFRNVDAVAPGSGNHLVDPTGPEFGGGRFTRSWSYGAYDGRVAFYEEMVSREHLLAAPQAGDACRAIKLPPAYATAGWYPTRSCLRQAAGGREHTVSLEGFVRREPSAPAAVAAAPANGA
jgi:hypothetical protein